MDKETLRKEHLKKMCEAGKISWETLARELVDYVCEEDIRECLGYANDGGAAISDEALEEYMRGDEIEEELAEVSELKVTCEDNPDWNGLFKKNEVEEGLDLSGIGWMKYVLSRNFDESWSKCIDAFIDDKDARILEVVLREDGKAYKVKIEKHFAVDD